MNVKGLFPRFLLLVLLVSLLLNGCGRVAGVRATPAATAAPATSTPEPTLTFTALPSSTATRAPTETPTHQPSPTRDRTATAALQRTATVEAMNARLEPDLRAYGVVPEDGHLVWQEQETIKLDLTQYLENQNYFLEKAGPLTDFVIQSRVTWNTSGALSLCGFTFDAEEDQLNGKQSRFFLMRLQFAPSWTIWRWEFDRFQDFLSKEWRTSGNIHDKNGSTNLLTLVVQGKDIDVFINRDKQMRVEDAKRSGGLLALSAHQESGKTTCRFEDTWVWAFDH